MLEALRSKKNNPIIVFFLAAIIIVFIAFFGPAVKSCGYSDIYAARVDGEVITDRDFSQRYAQVYRSYQQQMQEFNREQAEKMELRKKVLNQMITSKVLAREAERRGLAVDDQSLREAILDNPNFQTGGAFDKELYERVLNQNSLTVGGFESSLRDQLLAEKLASVVQSSLTVSTEEARRSFEDEQRSMSIEFVRVKDKVYEDKVGPVSEAEVEAWTKTPDAEEKIKKHYTKMSRAKYNTPKKVRARHILVKIDKDAPPDLRQQAQAKIKLAREAVVDQKLDFAEAAKRFSDDSTKDKGGDLGFFSEGQMVRPFEEAAFGMKPGEVSRIVESPFGYHVIKVEEIQEPVSKTLESVKTEIAQELAKEDKASTLSEKRAKELADALKAGKSLETLASESIGIDPQPLKVEDTGTFTQGRAYIPKIGVSKPLSAAAWKLTKDKPVADAPIRVENAWYVFKLKDRTEPGAAEFEKVKAMNVGRLAYQKRSGVLDDWSDKVIRTRAQVDIHPLALSYDEEARAAARSRSRQ